MIVLRTEVDPSIGVVNSEFTKQIICTVLDKEGAADADITLIVGSDELLSELKKEFFHVEQFTDVIAFRLNNYDEQNIEGEIYISLPRARENAKNYKEPLNKEEARLIIHGSLHLLNYEDDTDKQKQKMRGLEDANLEQVDWRKLNVDIQKKTKTKTEKNDE